MHTSVAVPGCLGDDLGMLLARLVAAVKDFRDRTSEPQWSIAARARMAGSQLSAILAAGKPGDEGGSKRSPEIASVERIAAAVECELMVIPQELVPEVEKVLAKGAKKRGGGS